jgi:uncharacterized protein YkwD
MVKMCLPTSQSRSVWPALAALGLCLGGFGCSSVEYAEKASQANPLDNFEQDVVAQLNGFRVAAGASKVKVCASLNVSASLHSDDQRDRNYLDDDTPEGSRPPDRACDAGYMAACGGGVAMAELLAKGNADGASTLEQWNTDATTTTVLRDPQFAVVGLGRSLGGESAIWTMDLAAADEASCGEGP